MEELEHYRFWRGITREDVKPDKWKILLYFMLSKIFGLTFGLKLMERGEERAQRIYNRILKYVPSARHVIDEENRHERELINLIDEERLHYIGSIVLGLK